MKLSQAGIDLIQHFEGCSFKAYLCPAGVWTIGYGHTGAEVRDGLVWDSNQCNEAFLRDVSQFERDVNSLVKVPLTQGQFDALVSFAYNCGSDIDADDKAEGLGDSTLLRLLNEGHADLAARQFERWISKGTAAEPGLRRRRKAEELLFIG
jgi:lysozyme